MGLERVRKLIMHYCKENDLRCKESRVGGSVVFTISNPFARNVTIIELKPYGKVRLEDLTVDFLRKITSERGVKVVEVEWWG